MSYNETLFLSEIIGCLPELFILSCCLLELMISLFIVTIKPYPLIARTVLFRMSFYFFISILLMLFWPAYHEFARIGHIFFNGAFHLNLALVYTKIIIRIFVIFILLISRPYILQSRSNNYEFGVLIGLMTVAMFFVVSAYSLLILYLSLEFQAVVLFILLAWHRHSAWSLDATLKYVLINVVASVFFLIAISWCYVVVGSISYNCIVNHHVLLVNSFLPLNDSSLLLYPEYFKAFVTSFLGISGVMGSGWQLVLMPLLITFSLKFGIAPFHLWVSDVYASGMTPVVGLVATASKISYVSAFSILLGYIFYPILRYWDWFFLTVALLSVCLGNFSLVKQTNLLRTLGISSIASGGYLYLIFAFAPAVYLYPLAISYIILASFLNSTWFLPLCTTFLVQRSSNENSHYLLFISDLASLRYSSVHKLWVLGLAVSLCSFMGIPPLLGFWGKFLTYITYIQGIEDNVFGIGYLLILMLLTLVGAYAYLQILSVLLFETPSYLVSYTNTKKVFHFMNFMFLIINILFIFIPNIDMTLSCFTPYYYTSTGFFWETLVY